MGTGRMLWRVGAKAPKWRRRVKVAMVANGCGGRGGGDGSGYGGPYRQTRQVCNLVKPNTESRTLDR